MAGAQLDARVWGKLQDHVPLQCIHEKMPYKDFFRLGVVCKSWKQATLQRVEPNPYFVTVNLGRIKWTRESQYLNGILTYDVATGESSWRRQHFDLHGDPPLEVEGLIYCNHPDNPDLQAVFNIHSNMWHVVPPPPEISNSKSALAMTVDKSERPYSFKLFLGCTNKKTQIYDSRAGSWRSRSPYLATLPATSTFASCLSRNGCVYLSHGRQQMVLMYSIERDNWTMLPGPPLKEGEGRNDYNLGTWDGRIFTTREDLDQDCIVVWELVDETNNEWVEYARISGAKYFCLLKWGFGSYSPPAPCPFNYTVATCFCGEYLLIYHWQSDVSKAYGLLLFNLATKECKTVELPEGTRVATKDREGIFVYCGDSESEGFVSEESE